MADDVTLPGTGADVATDDVGGSHYQRIKIDLGADGVASPLERGQQAGADSLPVVLASDDALTSILDAVHDAVAGALKALLVDENGDPLGTSVSTWDDGLQSSENHVGKVSSPDDVLTVSLTVPTGALTAGDVLAATQEIANFMRVNGGTAMLHSVVVVDTDDQGAEIDLTFFDANTSMGAEESAPDIDDTEILTMRGGVNIATTDYKDKGGSKVATKTNIGLMLKAGTLDTSMWIAATTPGTPTYASGVVTVLLGLLRN